MQTLFKDWLLAMNLTKLRAARELHIARQTVYNYANGQELPLKVLKLMLDKQNEYGIKFKPVEEQYNALRNNRA